MKSILNHKVNVATVTNRMMLSIAESRGKKGAETRVDLKSNSKGAGGVPHLMGIIAMEPDGVAVLDKVRLESPSRSLCACDVPSSHYTCTHPRTRVLSHRK